MAATKQCGRGLRGRSPPGAGLGGSLRGGKRGKVTFGELTEICRFFCDPDCGGEVSGADRFDGGPPACSATARGGVAGGDIVEQAGVWGEWIGAEFKRFEEICVTVMTDLEKKVLRDSLRQTLESWEMPRHWGIILH
jgi:hypothetical protein